MISRIDIEDMTDAQDKAPERIWASSNRRRQWAGCGGWRIGRNPDDQAAGFPDAEYVRADLAYPSQAGDKRVAAAYRDALQLATAIWERAYREVAPDWKPLPDLLGILSQIDNMVAGLLSRAESQAAEQMRLRSENLLMRASLEPFAKEAGAWEDSCDQEQLVEPFPGYDGLLTVGNCRRARAALAAMDTPKGGGE